MPHQKVSALLYVLIIGAVAAAAFLLFAPATKSVETKKIEPTQTVTTVESGSYSDPSRAFTVLAPSGLSFQPLLSEVVDEMGGTTTVSYPEGTVGIPGLVRVNLQTLRDAQVTKEKPFLSYDSCCSGTRHWYDPLTTTWHGVQFGGSQYGDNGKELPEKVTPIRLNDAKGMCSLTHMIGKNAFTILKAWDEGVPATYYYMLILDKDRVLTFASPFGIFTEGAVTSEGDTRIQKKMNDVKMILESVTLQSTAVQTKCE